MQPASVILLKDFGQVDTTTCDANGNYSFTVVDGDVNLHNYQAKYLGAGNDNASSSQQLPLTAVPPPNHNTATSIASSANPPTVGVPFIISGQVTETS